RFEALGWPTPELEEWKYTNLSPISRIDWRTDDGAIPAQKSGVVSLRMKALAELVFVNGRFLDAAGDAAGVEIVPISAAASHPMFEHGMRSRGADGHDHHA